MIKRDFLTNCQFWDHLAILSLSLFHTTWTQMKKLAFPVTFTNHLFYNILCQGFPEFLTIWRILQQSSTYNLKFTVRNSCLWNSCSYFCKLSSRLPGCVSWPPCPSSSLLCSLTFPTIGVLFIFSAEHFSYFFYCLDFCQLITTCIFS